MSQIAILYGDAGTEHQANAIATAFKTGIAVVAQHPTDLSRKPYFTYTLDYNHIQHLVTARCRYLLDDPRRTVRRVPHMTHPCLSLYVTLNQNLASLHARAFLQQRGWVEQPIITQSTARAQLPISIGKWIYVDDFDTSSARTLFKTYKNSGYTFATVGDSDLVEETPKRITVQNTDTFPDETLWRVLMACDAVVYTKRRDRRIHHVTGRLVASGKKELAPIIAAGFPIDLNDAAAQGTFHGYDARTRRIITEAGNYHPDSNFASKVLS